MKSKVTVMICNTRSVEYLQGVIHSYKSRLLAWFSNKLYRLTFKIVSRVEVQRALVDVFENQSTPMCKALQRAVEQYLPREYLEIDADQVRHLDRYVEEEIDKAVSELRDEFEQNVTEMIDERESALVEFVIKTIVSRLRD